jgi:transcriptional regulator with XRE-family HTH domain
MQNEEWSAARIGAALAKLEDAGHSQPKMAEMAGISQSTVNRWIRGKVQPGYSAVRKLAVAVWRRHPDVARELVEASGYAWAEPQDVPEPVPELDDDPETLDALRSAYRDAPEMVREAARALIRAEARASGRSAGESSSQGRRAS